MHCWLYNPSPNETVDAVLIESKDQLGDNYSNENYCDSELRHNIGSRQAC